MTGIQCRKGHIFAMIVDNQVNSAEWKLEEAYYKAQGCEVVRDEHLRFAKPEMCSHCDSLEHEFKELIEEIKNQE